MDYDVWQEWTHQLLKAYGECAARQAELVNAWPLDGVEAEK